MFVVRAAREANPGQYVIVADKATLQCDQSTISLAGAQPRPQPLFHAPLAFCKLGISTDKLLVVPLDRGPCWICEFSDASAAGWCFANLKSQGVDLAMGEGPGVNDAESVEDVLAVLHRMEPTDFERVVDALIGSLQ